jgi:hypothetical protein
LGSPIGQQILAAFLAAPVQGQAEPQLAQV